jgi:hypothetical protein
MSYFRSYFEKNNTVLKKSYVNTAKNPTTEIFYGSLYSKFIFKVDLTDLKDKVDNGDLVIGAQTKHYLKMTNTVIGDSKLIGQSTGSGRNRATSFDLIVFDTRRNPYTTRSENHVATANVRPRTDQANISFEEPAI